MSRINHLLFYRKQFYKTIQIPDVEHELVPPPCTSAKSNTNSSCRRIIIYCITAKRIMCLVPVERNAHYSRYPGQFCASKRTWKKALSLTINAVSHTRQLYTCNTILDKALTELLQTISVLTK